MATLKTIRKRITSVKNTQKITKAMKMVAAAKLRRAQQAVTAARPYAKSLRGMIAAIASAGSEGSHPLFVLRENPKKIAVLTFTSNRGLCGGFNSNLLRRVETHLKEISHRYEEIDVSVIGKKGRDFYRARKRELKDVFLDYATSFPMAEAEKTAKGIAEGYLEGKYDEYFIVYNRFKSALSQEVEIQKLIPLDVGAIRESPLQSGFGCLYEPSRMEVLNRVVPKYLAVHLYQAHLESAASELGARMTAMENATSNADDMIGSLTLQYNRLRQAAITRELMDIVNGAEAIK